MSAHRSNVPVATPGVRATSRDLDPRRIVTAFDQMNPEDQSRLREIAATLRGEALPEAFVLSSLRSTADLLRELREAEQSVVPPSQPDRRPIAEREHVQRFIQEHAISHQPENHSPRRERKREERDRLHTSLLDLIRQARQARGRHEVKKTRSMLLRIDQREVRRTLGNEGDELCRQINTWLRSTAPMF